MSFVKYEPKGNIAYLVIDREKALNALNSQVLADLDAALDAVDLNEIRCLSMSCDFRICSDTAVFGQPETGLGITPGFGGTQRLARLVGPGMAKQMVYTARNIKAEEALRIGLVNAVYPLEELYGAAEKLASQIAVNAPIAVRASKKAINEGLDLAMDEAVVVEEKAFGSCFESQDQQEGMGAFLEKRKHEPFTNK